MTRTAPALYLAAALGLFAAPLAAQDSAPQDAAPADASGSTDDQMSSQPMGSAVTAEMMLSVGDLMESRILSLGGDYDPEEWSGEEPLQPIFTDLTEIGTVQDVILSVNGQMQGITTDIGGFIGIGRKTVMLPLTEIRLARTEGEDEITVITRLDQQALEDAPEFSLGD